MFNKKSTKLIAAMGMTLFAGSVQAANVAVNGGFETGDFTGWTQFESFPGNQTVDLGAPGNTSSAGLYHGHINNTQVASNSLFKQANVGIGTVAPGQAWTVSFDARGSFGPGGVAFAEFFNELSGGGTSACAGCGILGGAPLALNTDPEKWTSFSFSGTNGVDVSGGVTLQLGATTGGAPGSFANMFYDNVVIDVATPAVPVPAAVWLFGSGLLGLVGVARRKKALAA